MDVATPVTTPPVTMLVVTATAVCAATAPRGTVLGNRLGGEPSTGLTGAQAVWRTGFWTWVDLTDCMMIGEWVFACRALQACIELDLKNLKMNTLPCNLLKIIKRIALICQNLPIRRNVLQM